MTVSPASPKEFTVHVRIPGWSAKNSVMVNSQQVGGAVAGEYLAILRRRSANDKIDLNLDMTPRVLKANPAVTEDRGRVASFQRGPIVFCMEHLDQGGPENIEADSYYAWANRGPASMQVWIPYTRV